MSRSEMITTFELSAVEKTALESSPYQVIYPPAEKIPTIVVPHFPLLGELTAMRFIEWVQSNPEGVISLPTGKTPEYFIKWVCRLLKGWETKDIRKELERWGIDAAKKPGMKGLHFVQIDEFYPIDSSQANSFLHYVTTYYLSGFGLDASRAMLIDPCQIGVTDCRQLKEIWSGQQVDLSLRYRPAKTLTQQKQKTLLERIDQWCMDYEEKIRSLGGIGFFLGGIGPDGHIGFNISGSDHHSTTRLCPINYETQAAAAGDLGGIETARKCHVITIGLETITQNPDCTAVIMAAGQAKAAIAAEAIQSKRDVRYPATALQALRNARFYLTEGAALGLSERQYQNLCRSDIDPARAEQIMIDLAIERGHHAGVFCAPGTSFPPGRQQSSFSDIDQRFYFCHKLFYAPKCRKPFTLRGDRFLQTTHGGRLF
jgi:glucosamine-6-phosphate deaminase